MGPGCPAASGICQHEDLERLERVNVKDYKQEAKTQKEKLQLQLMQNHRVRKRHMRCRRSPYSW